MALKWCCPCLQTCCSICPLRRAFFRSTANAAALQACCIPLTATATPHSRSVRVMVVSEGQGQTTSPAIDRFHRCAV